MKFFGGKELCRMGLDLFLLKIVLERKLHQKIEQIPLV